MKFNTLIFITVICTTSLLWGCGGSQDTVSQFLDSVIAKREYTQYLAPNSSTAALTNSIPLSYKIENVSDTQVSALITFRGYKYTQLANGCRQIAAGDQSVDIYETHVFFLENGKIKNIR